MSKSNPVERVGGWVADHVIGPPLVLVGGYVEGQIRQAMPDLPEPPDLPELPVWAVPVVVTISIIGTVVLQLVADPDHQRTERERAEPEPEATAERGTTSVTDVDEETPVEAALDTLNVEHPPAPDRGEVRSAYRERVIEAHPDQGGEAEQFIEIQKAWETITERQQLSDGDVDGEVTQES